MSKQQPKSFEKAFGWKFDKLSKQKNEYLNIVRPVEKKIKLEYHPISEFNEVEHSKLKE